MSLNGLDAVAIKEAYQSALTDGGHWFLLRYAARDQVELYRKGTAGLADVQNAVTQFGEESPLFGYIHYRRRKVVLKYIPEDMSRLLQARVAVHFPVIQETFSPHDTVFTFSCGAALKDSALASELSLHTAAMSRSNTEASLAGIIEDESDSVQKSPGSDATKAPGELMNDLEQHDKVRHDKVSAILAHIRDAKSDSPISEASQQRPRTKSDTNKDLPLPPSEASGSNLSETLPLSEETPRPSFSSQLSNRTSTSSARPSLIDIERSFEYKPRIKLGPRPSNDSSGNQYGSFVSGSPFRPVASLPAGLRKASTRRKPVPTKASSPPTSPNSALPSWSTPLSPASSYSSSLRSPTSPDQNPLNMGGPRPFQHAGALPHHREDRDQLPGKMTPEKRRLMKALELRQRQKNSPILQSQSESVTSAVEVDHRTLQKSVVLTKSSGTTTPQSPVNNTDDSKVSESDTVTSNGTNEISRLQFMTKEELFSPNFTVQPTLPKIKNHILDDLQRPPAIVPPISDASHRGTNVNKPEVALVETSARDAAGIKSIHTRPDSLTAGHEGTPTAMSRFASPSDLKERAQETSNSLRNASQSSVLAGNSNCSEVLQTTGDSPPESLNSINHNGHDAASIRRLSTQASSLSDDRPISIIRMQKDSHMSEATIRPVVISRPQSQVWKENKNDRQVETQPREANNHLDGFDVLQEVIPALQKPENAKLEKLSGASTTGGTHPSEDPSRGFAFPARTSSFGQDHNLVLASKRGQESLTRSSPLGLKHDQGPFAPRDVGNETSVDGSHINLSTATTSSASEELGSIHIIDDSSDDDMMLPIQGHSELSPQFEQPIINSYLIPQREELRIGCQESNATDSYSPATLKSTDHYAQEPTKATQTTPMATARQVSDSHSNVTRPVRQPSLRSRDQNPRSIEDENEDGETSETDRQLISECLAAGNALRSKHEQDRKDSMTNDEPLNGYNVQSTNGHRADLPLRGASMRVDMIEPQKSRRNDALLKLELVPSPNDSEDQSSLDDRLMDELKDASVQEAKPMSVSKSPMRPVFARFDTKSDDSSKTLRSVSSPLRDRVRAAEAQPCPLPQSAKSRAFSTTQVPPPGSPGSNNSFKRSGVSNNISQRIRALEQLSSRPSSPTIQQTSSQSSFTSLRERTSSFKSLKARVPDQTSFGSFLKRPNTANAAVTSTELTRDAPPLPTPRKRPESMCITSTTNNTSLLMSPPLSAALPQVAQSRPEFRQNKSTSDRHSMVSAQLSSLLSPRSRFSRKTTSRRSSRASTTSTISPALSPTTTSTNIPCIDENGPQDTIKSPSFHRLSFASKRSFTSRNGSDTDLVPSGSAPGDRTSLGTSPPDSSITGVLYEDKKDSRRSRLAKRMSNMTSFTGTKRRSGAATSTTKLTSTREDEISPPTQPTGVAKVIDLGDINIQFPDTLLWKRRHLLIENTGDGKVTLVLLPASGEQASKQIATKRYGLDDFQSPAIPDLDRQELPHSVLLDFKEGSTLQCACETAAAQQKVYQLLRLAYTDMRAMG